MRKNDVWNSKNVILKYSNVMPNMHSTTFELHTFFPRRISPYFIIFYHLSRSIRTATLCFWTEYVFGKLCSSNQLILRPWSLRIDSFRYTQFSYHSANLRINCTFLISGTATVLRSRPLGVLVRQSVSFIYSRYTFRNPDDTKIKLVQWSFCRTFDWMNLEQKRFIVQFSINKNLNTVIYW